jgi:hypothetical protein
MTIFVLHLLTKSEFGDQGQGHCVCACVRACVHDTVAVTLEGDAHTHSSFCEGKNAEFKKTCFDSWM